MNEMMKDYNTLPVFLLFGGILLLAFLPAIAGSSTSPVPAVRQLDEAPDKWVVPSVSAVRDLPAEDLYVQTDRHVYFAGDRLFFKVYLHIPDHPEHSLQSAVACLTIAGQDGNHVSRLEPEFQDRTAHGSIRLPDTLQTGIYRLTAWTSNMLIAGTSPFYREIAVINRFDQEIRNFILEHDLAGDPEATAVPTRQATRSRSPFPELKPDRLSYGPREKVRLQVNPGSGMPGPASASVSVTREETLFQDAWIITDWHEGLYAGKRQEAGPVDMPSTGGIPLLPEHLGPVISGRVVDNGSGKPMGGAVVFLSAEDSLTNLKYDRTKADGSFFFLLGDYHKGKTLHVSVFRSDDPEANPRIEIREKFPAQPFSPGKMRLHPHIHAFMEEALIAKRVRLAYGSADFGLEFRDAEAFAGVPPLLYGLPVHTVFTRDYLPLENLAEISVEIVPNLRIRPQGNSYSVRMINSGSAVFFPDPPIFFMNGVWLHAVDDVARLSSADIMRIEVLSRPWMFGSLEFSGIVGIFTPPDGHRVPVHPTTKTIRVNPAPGEVKFSPDPHAGGGMPHVPDYRETLFWDPDIRLEAGQSHMVEFTTGDLPGRFVVTLEGMTECGIPFSQSMTINVE